MTTALGLDVVTSCAAARAGLSRARQIEDFPVRSLEDGSVSGVLGHPVALATRGFEGDVRLLRLLQFGLQDLLRQTDPQIWKGTRVGFYLSMPSPERIYEGTAWIPDEETRKTRGEQAEKFRASRPKDQRGPLEALLARAGDLAGWPDSPSLKYATRSGRTGVAEALGMAAADINAETIDVAVVGGIDSLLDEDTLVWLAETGRLKTANAPLGLMPGEAAAFLVIEERLRVRRAPSRILGSFVNGAAGRESRPWTSGQVALGDGIAEAVSSLNQENGGGAPPWMILDHSGESYSSLDWGHAITRLTGRKSGGAEAVWYPAISFGETEAAFGAVAACMALRAFARGYAPADYAFVIAAGLGAARHAFQLTGPREA